MPATFSVKCPECRANLTSRKPIPGGKLLTCPKCEVMFAAPKPPDDDIVEDVEVMDDDGDVMDDVEIVDESPARKSKRAVASKSAAANLDFEVVDEEEVDDDEDIRPPRRQFRTKSKNTGKMGVIIGVSVGGGILLAGSALLLWWLLRGGGDEPLAFVPSNSAIVGGVDLKAVMASPLGSSLAPILGSPAAPFARLATASGSSVNDGIEQIVFGGSMAGAGGGTFVVKTTGSIDSDKLAAAFPGSSKSTVGGRTVHRLPPGGPKSMFVPNKRIAVFSDLPDDQLGKLAASSGRSANVSGDAERLAARFRSGTIWFVFVADDAMKAQMTAAANANPLAKMFSSSMQASKGSGVSMTIQGNDVELILGELCTDAAAAQQSTAETKQMLEKFNTDLSLKAAMFMLPGSVRDPVNAAMSEIQSSAQYKTEDAMAIVTCKLQMSTLQRLIAAAAGIVPGMANPGGGLNQRGM